MSTVRYTVIDPNIVMPLIQIDSLVLTSLLEKTKKLTEEIETVLQQQTNSSVQSKTIIVRKPIDLLREIEKNDSEDPYDQLLRLADALSIYEKSGDKIGNDFKHLFETIFVKACLKLRSTDYEGIQGCIGLNTVFLSTVVKVKDIKWLLHLIAIFYGCNQLFNLTKEHVETYSKIGSRDCQIVINKLFKSSDPLSVSFIYTIFIKTLIDDKNLEECKKLVSQGVSIYRTRSIEYCWQSNCLEKCYHAYSNPGKYPSCCFQDKLNAEIDIIKYHVIDKLYNDVDKALEIINWLVYEYPSRIGYKIKVEKGGKEYLDDKIKEYCEKNDKMDFYTEYIKYTENKNNQIGYTILTDKDFYISKGQKGDILSSIQDGLMFVMFYDLDELLSLGKNTFSIFNQMSIIASKNSTKIKFGVCNLAVSKDTYLKLTQTIMPLKDIPVFILYMNGIPTMRYTGPQTISHFIEFLNKFLEYIPQ